MNEPMPEISVEPAHWTLYLNRMFVMGWIDYTLDDEDLTVTVKEMGE